MKRNHRILIWSLISLIILESLLIVYLYRDYGYVENIIRRLEERPVDLRLSELYFINSNEADEHRIRILAVNFGLNDIEELRVNLTWLRRGEVIHSDYIIIRDLKARDFQVCEQSFYFDGAADTIIYEWMGETREAHYLQ